MPVPCLPSDVWLHIGGFLPIAMLYPLRELNSAFMTLFVRFRYGHIRLASFEDKEVEFMRHIQEPLIAPHVHHVELDIYRVAHRDTNNPKASHGVLYTLSDEDVLTEIVRTVEAFTNVVALDITWHPLPPLSSTTFSSPKAFGPIFHRIWRALGPRLDTFRLSLSARSLSAILSIDGSIATHLSELDLSFVPEVPDQGPFYPDNPINGDSVSVDNFVRTFITPIRKRLKKFRVELPRRLDIHPKYRIDARAFFAALEEMSFSSLTTLIVESPFKGRASENEAVSLDVLVRENLPTLRSLSIIPDQVFNYDIGYHLADGVDYTGLLVRASTWTGALTRLSLCVPQHTGDCENAPGAARRIEETLVAVGSILQSMSSSLAHVVLIGRFLSNEELRVLLEAMGADKVKFGLESLLVNIICLTPSTCDILALLLPSIDTLDMNIHGISADPHFAPPQEDMESFQDAQALTPPLLDDVDLFWSSDRTSRRGLSEPEKMFIVEMRSRCYPAWAIRRIRIQHPHYVGHRSGNPEQRTDQATARAALSTAVPRAEEVTDGRDVREWHSRPE